MRLNGIAAIIALLLVSGCAYKKATRDAQRASEMQQWDEAYQRWTEILEEEPANVRARLGQQRARLQASLNHLRRAGYYLDRDQLPEADFEIERVLALDPQNQEAFLLRDRLRDRIAERQQQANQLDRAQAEEKYTSMPMLSPRTNAPQNIYFPKPTAVQDIYIAIGRAYGVNILVDPKLRRENIALDLRNLSFFKALDTLMVLNRHFFMVIDDNTIVIMEDNKTNRDRYENQIVRTFYLSNVTPGDLKAHLRQLGLKEFAENDKLNAITVKGTPEQLALAEKVISANDKAQPEVLIEIELLEVNQNNLRRLGILPVGPDGSTPQYRAGVFADPVDRTNDDRDQNGLRGIFPSLNSQDFLTIVPAIAIDFLKENGDSKQVANPHLRVTSGQRANVRIGQRIPIANTSFTNAQLSGSTGGTNNFGDQALTTFQYNDVGISIGVTPRVHFNNEITLELELEISSIVTGGLQPVLGQRIVNTTIRLRNGETNVLAGLLTNEERKSLRGFPGLSDIPVLGKLFSNDEKQVSQTDIIMSTRPIIVRGNNITREDRAPYEISDLRLSSIYGNEKDKESPNITPSGNREVKPGDQPRQTPSAGSESNILPVDNRAGGYLAPLPSAAVAGEDSPDESGPPIEQLNADSESPPAPEGGDPFATNSAESADTADAEDSGESAVIAMTPTGVQARQDDVFSVQVFITNVANLKKGQLTLTFDPAVLQVEGVQAGDMFSARGMQPLLTPMWNNQTGRVSMIVSQRRSGPPFSGSGILAELKFRAIAPGSGALAFAGINLEDPDGTLLPVVPMEAAFEVSP